MQAPSYFNEYSARSPEDPIRALLGAAAYVHHEEARRATVTDLVSIFNTNNP